MAAIEDGIRNSPQIAMQQNRRFVAQAYYQAYNRNPSDEVIEMLAGQLTRGQTTREQLQQGLLAQAEQDRGQSDY